MQQQTEAYCERVIKDQGQAGWGAEKPDLIEDVLAHCRAEWTR